MADNYKEIKSLNWVEISDEEFNLLRRLVYEQIGINLTEQKKTLLMGRLQKLLRGRNFSTFREYYNFVNTDKSGRALSDLANSISTNHTFFYREKDHFDFFFEKTLPQIEHKLKTTQTNDIRVWSAGCSTGEEPYMLVMLMMEYFGRDYSKLNAGVLATDISETALERARAGIYTWERVSRLPEKYIKKYFKKLPTGEYRVIDEVKKEVVYRRFNLMNKQFPFKKQFDSIFCRNVMIYFDPPTREALVDRFWRHTAPGGFLFIGHSESLKREATKYKYIMPALYLKA
ncbi:MAG: CheR family methyltransferase [Candidatus Kapaibacterium sp.]